MTLLNVPLAVGGQSEPACGLPHSCMLIVISPFFGFCGPAGGSQVLGYVLGSIEPTYRAELMLLGSSIKFCVAVVWGVEQVLR